MCLFCMHYIINNEHVKYIINKQTNKHTEQQQKTVEHQDIQKKKKRVLKFYCSPFREPNLKQYNNNISFLCWERRDSL